MVGFLRRLSMEDSPELLYYAVRIPPEIDLHNLAINHPVDGYPFESQFPTCVPVGAMPRNSPRWVP